MAMNKINAPQLVQPHYLDKFAKSDGRNTAASNQHSSPAAPGQTARGSEQVQISEQAHKLAQMERTLESGRAALARVDDLREDRIAEARQRLSSGYYDSLEVRSRIAGRLDQVFEAMDAL